MGVPDKMTQTADNKAPKEKYLGSVRFFKHLITSLVILIIAGLVALVIYLWYDENRNPGISETLILDGPDGGDGRGILLTPENIEEWQERPEATDTHFTTEMSVLWQFTAWNIPSPNAFIANSTLNHRMFYFQVFLADESFEDGRGEMIYDSPYIPVGARLDAFSLHSPLSAGDYTAIVVYNIVDDDFLVVADVAVEVNISIFTDENA
jgi:hypothetical protein